MNRITNDEILTESDTKIILDNILDYSRKNKISVFKIGIVGAGEPLLNFDTIKFIIEYIKNVDADRKLIFYTITNGTLINENMLNFFYNNKQRITLNFSLDGYEDLHNYSKEAFNNTLDGIMLYDNIFHEKPVLNCTVSKQTLINKETAVGYFIEHGFEKVNFVQLMDIEDNNLTITHQEFLDFLQYVHNKKAIIFRQNRREKKYDCRTYGQLCGVGRTNIFITKQGIYPCCRFYKNNAYKIADFDTDFNKIESNMSKKLHPVKDGECYYNKHISGLEEL
jgi:uncharacterized protein